MKKLDQFSKKAVTSYIGYQFLSPRGILQLYVYFSFVLALVAVAETPPAELIGWWLFYAFIIFSLLQFVYVNKSLRTNQLDWIGLTFMIIWMISFCIAFIATISMGSLPFSSEVFFVCALILCGLCYLIARRIENS